MTIAVGFGLTLCAVLIAGEPIELPPPDLTGGPPLNATLAQRRSVREYADVPVSLAELGAVLWAGQGITSPEGFRTAPSAGGLYPLVLYVAFRSDDVAPCAVYRYEPGAHTLTKTRSPHVPLALWAAALQQEPVRQAPVVVVVAGDVARSAEKYGDRAPLYLHIEAGSVTQNILLEATALGLAAVPVGAFYESQAKQALGIVEEPLMLIPIGRPTAPAQDRQTPR